MGFNSGEVMQMPERRRLMLDLQMGRKSGQREEEEEGGRGREEVWCGMLTERKRER